MFGSGLKKNVIYDFMHNNNIERIHYAGSFQYYNLGNIWDDINIALRNGLKLINFATEPVITAEIAERCFGIKDFRNEPEGVMPGAYDMHTKHAGLYGKNGNYLYSREEELRDIKVLVDGEAA